MLFRDRVPTGLLLRVLLAGFTGLLEGLLRGALLGLLLAVRRCLAGLRLLLLCDRDFSELRLMLLERSFKGLLLGLLLVSIAGLALVFLLGGL